MKKLVLLLLLVVASLVSIGTTHALQPLPTTRDQVFSMIWEKIYRPVLQTSETQFDDVPEDSEYFDLLRYAKRRGILEDSSSFYPSALPTTEDVIIWLLRTRNVDSINNLQRNNYQNVASRYPMLIRLDPATVIYVDEVIELIHEFDTLLANQEHEVSFYSEKFHGKKTAFGETFDMNALTAAHPTWPHNTLARVTNTDNGKSVIVRVNDRGPFVPGRSMDLSLAAFLQISERSRGIATATIERLGDHELVPEASLYYAHVPDSSSASSSVAVEPVDTEEPENIEIEESVPTVCSRFENYYQKRITNDIRFVRGIPHVLQLGRTLVLQSSGFIVLRLIQEPDGTKQRIESWLEPRKEKYSFTPAKTGMHLLKVQTPTGRSRTYFMQVVDCT